MINQEILFLVYLFSASLFILSIRGLASPQTARLGNALGISGMFLAVVATILMLPAQNDLWIVLSLAAGAVIGTFSGLKVKITALPQMIAAFNGLGGLSSLLIGLSEILYDSSKILTITLGITIGSLAFSGSIIAFLKLNGNLKRNFSSVYKNILNTALFVLMLWLGFELVQTSNLSTAFILSAVTIVLGAALTLPVGGADMPIVIAVLNAFSGWAASAIGFSLMNAALIITGAIVGASGTILAYIMTKAINRSLSEVFFSHILQKHHTNTQEKTAQTGDPQDAAFIMENASSIIIVPGYGMAVAQAQNALYNMARVLREKYHVKVRFAIHPVAGRMPGHMNVLLAEAKVPYDDVFELEQINHKFENTDVAYVVGANDITNPLAKTDPSSPLYGMPVLDVSKAKTVFFVKRSLGSGYSGVENPLFFEKNTFMLYGDAKDVTEKIVQALNQNA